MIKKLCISKSLLKRGTDFEFAILNVELRPDRGHQLTFQWLGSEFRHNAQTMVSLLAATLPLVAAWMPQQL